MSVTIQILVVINNLLYSRQYNKYVGNTSLESYQSHLRLRIDVQRTLKNI